MKRSGARPRLCMIVHATYPQDVRVAREARLAVEHGFDVDVVALRDPGELKVENVGGVRVFRLPVTHRRGVGVVGVFREYLGYAALASVRAFWLALKRPYDVVQVHNPPDFLIVASILPRLLGARVILDIHDLSPDMFAMRFAGRPGANLADNTLKWLERWSARLADVVITVHEPYRRELVARSVPREKTAVVMNSLDEALIPQGDEPAPHDGFRVVYHGTITPPYGVQLIVEAAALVRGRIDDIQVEIYGAGDSLPGIRERADELGISEAVILSGRYLGQSEVLTRVRGADVGVIPNLATRLNKFALSSKLFEYVVLSIPVVCADLPTIREHFSDDEVLFFTAGDAVSLARALEAVASDPAAAAARAARALARYRKEYTWATSGEEYVGVLKRLTAPGRTQERGARYVGPPRYDHDRLAPVIAEPAQGGGAVFGSTEPFLFAEHFRIPSRHASLAELDPELEARDPLRRLGQLRWVGRDGKTSPRKLVWPSRANPSSSAIPLAEVRLDESPFYARVVPDGVAARWLGEGWNPTAPVTDRTGQRVASIWRDGDGSIFLPFDPSEVIVNYWSEAYRSISGRRVGRLAWRIGRPFYYRLRPALPRAGQIRIRQLLSRVQTRSTFPRWPVETSLNDFYGRVFGWLGELADEPIPWISPWPDGHDWALVLTHDVETADGYQRVAGVCDVERSLGYLVLLELRAAAICGGRRRRLGAARRRVRGGRPRPSPRRPRLRVPRNPATAATGDAALRRPVAGDGLPLALDASSVGLDAAARLRLRLVVPRHGSLRAVLGRLLQLASVLQRPSRRAPDHPPSGPHAVRDPRAPGRISVGGEDRLPPRPRRDGAPDHAPGLHGRRAPRRGLRPSAGAPLR